MIGENFQIYVFQITRKCICQSNIYNAPNILTITLLAEGNNSSPWYCFSENLMPQQKVRGTKLVSIQQKLESFQYAAIIGARHGLSREELSQKKKGPSDIDVKNY